MTAPVGANPPLHRTPTVPSGHSGRVTRLLAAGLAALLLCGCTQVGGDAPSPTTAAEIGGEWKGDLDDSTGKGYSVTVTIGSLVEGQDSAQAQYRGVGGPGSCDATWVYDGMKDSSWRFTEQSDGDCHGAGTVTLTPGQDDVLQYLWSEKGGDSANGFLARP